MVLLSAAQVLGQIFNPLTEQRNLYARVAGVRFAAAVGGCKLACLLWSKGADRTTQASSTKSLQAYQTPRRLNVSGHLQLQSVDAFELLFAAQTV